MQQLGYELSVADAAGAIKEMALMVWETKEPAQGREGRRSRPNMKEGEFPLKLSGSKTRSYRGRMDSRS